MVLCALLQVGACPRAVATVWLQKCHQQAGGQPRRGLLQGGTWEDLAESGGDLQAQQEETEPLQSWGAGENCNKQDKQFRQNQHIPNRSSVAK